jgi:predicted amidohydrolase YtcJ
LERKIPEKLCADLVMLNANVITVDPKDTIAEAVAVKKDKIIKVGTNEELNAFIGKRTKIMNLKGKTVTPGFIDPHTHFMLFGERLRQVNVRTPPCKNIADIQEKIRERVKVTPKGEWIVAEGIEHTALEE